MTATSFPVGAPATRARHGRRRSAAAQFGGRAVALAAFLAVPLTVGELHHLRATHSIITWLCAYTPARLLNGEVWTLPLSALIAARPDALGTNVVVPMIVLAPFVLAFGIVRPLRAFFAGHVVATLAAALAIGAGALLAVPEARTLLHTVDAGVSAGLAAAGGALAVALFHTRWRPLAVVVTAVLLAVFLHRIASEGPTELLADCEHVLAFATGVAVERARGARDRAP